MWSRDAAEPRLEARVPKTPLFLRPKNDSPQPSIPDNPLSGRLLYRRDPLRTTSDLGEQSISICTACRHSIAS
jgi:hypothetical protein